MHSRVRLGLIVATAVALISVAGVALVAAVGPSTFVPSGTTRYAMVSKGPGAASIANTNSTTFVDMPGMSTTIVVPSSQVAEVIVTFSGMVNTCDAMYVRAVIDGGVAAPSSTQFMWDLGGGAESHAFTFYDIVKGGTHTVKIQWRGLTNCNQQFVSARSMVVTANIH